MKKAMILCLMMFCASLACAKAPPPNQGTTLEQLKAAGLKAPATQKVAVLPFWDFSGEQRKGRISSVAAFLILQREGYQVMPLWEAEKAYLADKELEPGEPLRKQDATRIGKALGADLVCYGEVQHLETKQEYNFWWGYKDRPKASIKITLLSMPEGETVFWGKRSDEASGRGHTSETAMERHAICVSMANLLEPICKCLPADHIHNPKDRVTGDDILKLEKLWEGILKTP
jgi:TolB-like protein